MQSPDFPTTEPAMESTENSTLVFTVEVKVNKQQITQAVKKLSVIHMAKVSTLIGPNGEKKVFVPLAPDMVLWIYQQHGAHLDWIQLFNSKYAFFFSP